MWLQEMAISVEELLSVNSVAVGITLLLAIVLGQWAWGQWQAMRFHKAWAKAQGALAVNDLAAAEEAVRACTAIAPVSGQLRRVYGSILARSGKLAEAEEQLRFGADLEPRNAAGHLDLGYFLVACYPDRIEAAVDALSRALECSPELRATLADAPELHGLRQHERFRNLLQTKG